jgi:hypothetical protein
MQNMDGITKVIQHFINSPFSQQIENAKIVTSFVYLLVVNLEEEQEEHFANRMGTSVQEIRNAKKIQG